MLRPQKNSAAVTTILPNVTAVLRVHLKIQNKPVNLRLEPESMPLYRIANQQYRKLKSLLGRMERLSLSAL